MVDRSLWLGPGPPSTTCWEVPPLDRSANYMQKARPLRDEPFFMWPGPGPPSTTCWEVPPLDRSANYMQKARPLRDEPFFMWPGPGPPSTTCWEVPPLDPDSLLETNNGPPNGGPWFVARAGIEPATYRFSGGRSYQLSYLATPCKGSAQNIARRSRH